MGEGSSIFSTRLSSWSRQILPWFFLSHTSASYNAQFARIFRVRGRPKTGSIHVVSKPREEAFFRIFTSCFLFLLGMGAARAIHLSQMYETLFP